MQWILRRETDVGLTFGKRRVLRGIINYVDSEFANDLDGQRSSTGYVLSFPSCAVS